ncbi:glycosyltransferase family 2 protein [Lacticaseibacillus suilingensis]|uniref:glycosyltransferase family 2 protein n=1 Tax=Lacticaseibacillus suilingensis TaxID=2799577 RepID=UPI0022DF41CD|nr:glycosyltransferase family 2 protein [Lacticaseibacillus suilingensis]
MEVIHNTLDQSKLLSIIIPIYNAEAHLEECLQSVQDQEYANFEVLMIDDGSTDSSRDICMRYQSSDERFILIKTEFPQSGPAKARNIGLDMSVADYVMFVDADDSLRPGAIAKLMEYMGGVDVIIFEANIANDFPPRTVQRKLKESVTMNRLDLSSSLKILFGSIDHGAPWGKIFSRNFIGKQRFPENVRAGEDYIFNMSVFASRNSINAIHCSAHFYNYRVDDVNHKKNVQYTAPVVEAFLKFIQIFKTTSPKSAKYVAYRMGVFILSIENLKAKVEITRPSETYVNQQIIREYRDEIFQVEESTRRKAQFYVFEHMPKLYSWIYRISAH